jgi:maltose alpha-D-glucosyltransferase/alpha-amylase
MQEHWYKNAVFYSLDVETFFDSKNDGIGDFSGLMKKLDYIAGLGITCIWLLPFYPSPNRDNGYDVMDYYGVDARLGNLDDFVQIINKATEYGIRIIVDLVVNHTSHEHSWFQQARKSRNSPYRNYYIWADEPIQHEKEQLIFVGEENKMWTFDQIAGQYYLHRFYKEQPDLNIANPEVRKEILKIMGFWLDLGVSGFRVDAAEILIEPIGTTETNKENFGHFLNEMREYVASKKSDAVLLAEANVSPEKMKNYIQDGKRMHMLFNFFVNQYAFLSLATENASHVAKAIKELPPLHGTEQWLNFLRHHDELSLALLSDKERIKVFEHFAPKLNMRIYERGIRRRLSPMLNGDAQWLRFCYSLLFSLPGVPLIRYGDEIAMGEDLSLEGRKSVRTPMQWSDENNGGFSNASADKLVHPVIKENQYGYHNINVKKAQTNPSSLLNWMKRLIKIRMLCPEIGNGKIQIVDSGQPQVLILLYGQDNNRTLLLHNFSRNNVSVTLANEIIGNNLFMDVLNNEQVNGEEPVQLSALGYKWLRFVHH